MKPVWFVTNLQYRYYYFPAFWPLPKPPARWLSCHKAHGESEGYEK